METPQISIIVPVYNVEIYLCQCLDSVIAQTFTDWECILVDDGSTDDSGSICDEYAQKDNRFKVIHQVNSGSSSARNKGLSVISGKYTLCLDSDDWIDSDYLTSLITVADADGADLVISAFVYDYGDRTVACLNKPTQLAPSVVTRELLTLLHAGLWNKLVRTEIIQKNQLQFPKHDFYEDMYFSISLMHFVKSVAYSSVPAYHYRINNQSLTHSSDVAKRVRMYKDFVCNLTEIYDKYNLWKDSKMMEGLYLHVNGQKLKLLDLPQSEEVKRLLSDTFPESYKFFNWKGKVAWLNYLALKYRTPFFVIIRKYIEMSYKVVKILHI
ncbi:glycosyltransferase family 2 protein [Prevotella sp. E13-27]|uniref:glycosyltransferase family 2 protein n=1 Tax=Prevotella sp. E13-27 TaxID=2938122 RepID=UPI00200B6CD0|nr:glycosyltransferase [Prevotella sp. E13-27]MCK8623648.1 glycosyltransferase [Prevotella sp. E13-27]